ncbi:hypothetical protein L0F63_006563 [Massospora cicadina]|nr:hypothetical protein L0F63_006563 [Massospora cicadina]
MDQRLDEVAYNKFYDDGIDVHFTWRAVIVGSMVGCVVAASNLYLGLKSGWVFGASIFGAILSYAILKPLSKVGGHLGGAFGIKENCTAQAAATAAGGLTASFVAAIPALYHLGLLPPIEACWGMFLLWTAASAFYGMFFAVPLRNYYILKKRLVFPTYTATAHTIRALHTGDRVAMVRWILYPFLCAFMLKVASYFMPVLTELHPLYWLSLALGSRALSDVDLVFRWKLQLSTAFVGAGMLAGPTVSFSFFGGNLLAWGILGPLLYYTQADVLHDTPFGFSSRGTRVQTWNLWVGIVILVVASFTELGCEYESMWHGIRGGTQQLYGLLRKAFPTLRAVEQEQGYDPVKEEHRVPLWMWSSGVMLALKLTIFVLRFYFEMGVGMALLAAALGFLFSFIGCQSAGDTDMNPVGVVSKTSQLVFAAFPTTSLKTMQITNVMAGAVAGCCASQSVEMVGDLKTGYLLKASPRSQLYGQVVGSCAGIVFSVLVFMLFAKAYPCILTPATKGCPFTVPAALAWSGITQAITTNILETISHSCRVACLIAALLTFFITLLKKSILKPYAAFLPNLNAIGLAFVNPAPFIPLANLIGCLISLVWSGWEPSHWGRVHQSLASGLIAGEGIGGLIHALFTIVGLSQLHVATGFGCPNANPFAC